MARGLPTNFALDLPPQDGPVQLGDFLDEPPQVHTVPKPARVSEAAIMPQEEQRFTPSLVPERRGVSGEANDSGHAGAPKGTEAEAAAMSGESNAKS